jgi:hypothetical protein
MKTVRVVNLREPKEHGPVCGHIEGDGWSGVCGKPAVWEHDVYQYSFLCHEHWYKRNKLVQLGYSLYPAEE